MQPVIDGYLEPRFRSKNNNNKKKIKIEILFDNIICYSHKLQNKELEEEKNE